MRIPIVLLILLIHVSSFSKKNGAPPVISKSSLATQARVDSLNKQAHKIFLHSPDSARKIAASALLLAEKINYAEGKGHSFYNIGLIYWSQSYYAISLFYIKSALNSFPKSDPLDIAESYRALGRTYAELKDYKKAIANLDKALLFSGTDDIAIAENYSQRAFVYCALKNYGMAMAAASESMRLNKKVNEKGNIAVLYGRLAVISYGRKDYKTARLFNDTAYRMSFEVDNRRLRARVIVEQAMILNNLGKYDEAITEGKKAILLADSIGVVEVTTGAYNAIVNSYELKNDLKEALAFQRHYDLVRDSLTNIAKLKTVELVQNYYDLNAKMNGIKRMEQNAVNNKAKIQSQNKLILILISSLVVVIGILSATYYFFKQKKLLSNKLQQQHTELLEQKKLVEVQTDNLQKVNGLKDKLLAVIGHDLRSPVANLTNIIEMFDTGYLTAEEVHELMRDINPIVKGAALTLSNLVEWAGSQIKGQGVQSSKIDVYLLGVEMEQTFLHSLHQKNISFDNHAYPGQAILADENHIKVILRNLISNAIKFTNQKGSITLSTIIQDNELIISVKDTGKGMTPEEMDKLFSLNSHFSNSGTSGEKGTGIGLLLCKELVELNGGKIKVSSVVGKGSTFYFNMPLMKAYA